MLDTIVPGISRAGKFFENITIGGNVFVILLARRWPSGEHGRIFFYNRSDRWCEHLSGKTMWKSWICYYFSFFLTALYIFLYYRFFSAFCSNTAQKCGIMPADCSPPKAVNYAGIFYSNQHRLHVFPPLKPVACALDIGCRFLRPSQRLTRLPRVWNGTSS